MGEFWRVMRAAAAVEIGRRFAPLIGFLVVLPRLLGAVVIAAGGGVLLAGCWWAVNHRAAAGDLAIGVGREAASAVGWLIAAAALCLAGVAVYCYLTRWRRW